MSTHCNNELKLNLYPREELKDECHNLLFEVASKRKQYPKACVKHLSKTLEAEHKALRNATVVIPPQINELDNMKYKGLSKQVMENMMITLQNMGESTTNCLKEVDHVNQSLKDINTILTQITNEPRFIRKMSS